MRVIKSANSIGSSSTMDEDHLAAVIREFGRSMREVTGGLDDAMNRWESAHRSSLRPIRVILGSLSKINYLRNIEDLGKLKSFEGIVDRAITKNLGLLDKVLPKVLALASDFEGAIRKMRLMEKRVSELQRRGAGLLEPDENCEQRVCQLVDNVDALSRKLRQIVSMYEDEYLFRLKTIRNIEELLDSKELYTNLLLWTMEPYLESERIEAIRKEIGTHIEETRSLVSRHNLPANMF
ncbi:MAG: hypothetical protein ACFFBU_01410 [Promethearchaeota archaeon]